MDNYDIESIRSATFREARRGWDRREVENYLDGLADWLEAGGGDDVGSYAVQKKLERAGQTTARILATAEQEAETLRVEAREEAHRTLETARAEAAKATETARSKAKRTVEEGERRRSAIETVIADLVARRDEVVADIDRLAGDLRDATATYRQPDKPPAAGGKRPGGGKRPATGEQVEA